MNATRAATIRGRAWVGGVVSLGRVQTPTLAMIVKREREIQAFVPEPYWLVHADVPAAATRASGSRATRRGSTAAERADEIVAKVSGKDGDDREGRAQGAVRARAAALRPHLAPARREPPLRLHRAPHAAGRADAVRGQEGDHVPAHELALPVRRHGPAAEADRRDAAADPGVPRRRDVRHRPRPAAAPARRQRREGRRPPRDHPDRRRARRRDVLARRAPHLRPRRAPLPRRLPSAGALRAHDRRHAWSRTSASARAARSRSRPGWRGVYGARAGRGEAVRGRGLRGRRAADARGGPDGALRRRRARGRR